MGRPPRRVDHLGDGGALGPPKQLDQPVLFAAGPWRARGGGLGRRGVAIDEMGQELDDPGADFVLIANAGGNGVFIECRLCILASVN